MKAYFAAVSVSPTELADMAREVEALGYEALWNSEIQYDPFIGLTLAAYNTSHIALRTGIAVAFARNPMTTAVLANDLQLVSRGRFTLGMGSQLKAHITRRFGMPWSQPADRMREYVLAVRAVWDSFGEGKRLRFRGEFYRHTLKVPFFDPGPNPFGTPPIFLAGVGRLMTRVAGEVADGFIVHSISSARFLREYSLPALREGRELAGKPWDGFELHAAPIVATGRDERELAVAVRRAREQIAFYTSPPTYAAILELHGLGDLRTELQRLAAQGRVDEMADVIDDEVLNTFAFVGEPAQVAAKLHAQFGDLLSGISFYQPHITDPEYWMPVVEALRALEGTGARAEQVPVA